MKTEHPVSSERSIDTLNGWQMLVVVIAFLAGSGWWLHLILASNSHSSFQAFGAVLALVVTLILAKGFFTLEPNSAAVLLLFGSYCGSERTSGFHWANPFYTVAKMSLRSRNLNTERLKVNDKRGNPIEIGAVVVWRVQDTAQAMFDVEDFNPYVHIQCESALRHLASSYAYDYGEDNETTLRGGGDEVSLALQKELQERLVRAGVQVEEARIAHLAYAPEIAQAMLRRQQAEAVIAARTTIVQGAVSMVEMALHQLAERNIINLDDERRASMVSNLLVVLCGEGEVSPVINTGTLYQ